ncbi:ATP-binding protein [Halobium salinum]|uniref:histidine kinase n=1 Tax=Halobium salinum TaxID=1364940 RepID=A0ABD5P645_9EURY|nr:sensor histidine kinase [Halobium salinum]
MRLRTRLVVTLFLITFVLGGTVYGGVELYESEMVAQERADVDRTASLTADQVDAAVAEQRDFVGYMASQPEAREFDRTTPFLTGFLDRSRFFSVQLVDRDGTVRRYRGAVDEATRRDAIGSDVRDRAYVRAALNGTTYVADPVPVSGTDRHAVVFSAPVYDRSEVVGALAATIYVNERTLLTAAGPLTSEVQSVAVGDANTTVHEPVHRFDESITSTATVDSTGWTVTVSRDRAALDARVATLQLVQGFGLLVVFVLMLGFGLLEYRTTLDQTERLLAGFTAVGAGNYDRELSLSAGEEWQEIGDRFNELATGIEERERTLREQRQRLEVLNRVLRHNVRTDVSLVVGYADVVREAAANDGDSTELREAVDIIEERGKHIGEMSKTARRIESVVSDDRDPVELNLGSAVDEALDAVRGAHPDAVATSSVSPGVEVLANPALPEALEQLCTNAVEHNSEPNPSVTVSASRYEAHGPSDEIDDAPSPTDGRDAAEWYAALAIADGGPGIPDHEKEVLDAGRETPLRHGSGLGLWFVYWVVTKSGGRVTFEDRHDGTTVVVHLPLADVDTATATGADA